MDTGKHWEKIYRTKAPEQVSWFRCHLDTSLAMIESVSSGDRSLSIIDVGAGSSTLVDDLLERGYRNITLLDLSSRALNVTKDRLAHASSLRFIVGDVTKPIFAGQSYDLWHDRAVFHFLTDAADRSAYVRNVALALRPGGHVIVGTFGPEGPSRCSGLDVIRYDAAALHREFGSRFKMVRNSTELHRTPSGATQQFIYCLFRLDQ